MARWLDPSPVPVPDEFEALHLHPLAAQTLIRRGITDLGTAKAFLNPQAVPPVYFPGVELAVELIRNAIKDREQVCVWGDFDVDGQTSTTLLVQVLQFLGADPVHHIPVRAREGHGIHISSLKQIVEGGARLLLTCDTGITAYEAVDFARRAGLKVVITDHHLPGRELPSADAILNPRLLPEGHPLADLAGVGVAYKLAEALLEEEPRELERLLDLAALGLIADVALLQGETRSLAQKGIEALRRTGRLGLRIIAENSQTELESLNEETIGFTFGPRLNALGRLDDANSSVELLLSRDPERVRVLATQLENLNVQRRLLTSQVYRAAEAQLRDDPSLLSSPILVLFQRGWPGGVVGIAASHLVEHYHKPVILLSEGEDGILRGSARSVENLHITDAIASQSELLLGFGGHPMAAGLSLPAGKLTAFRRGVGRAVELQLGTAAAEEPVLRLDAWLRLEELTLDLAESLEVLAPFGAGNPELVFAARNVTLKAITTVGSSREHRRLTVEDETGRSQSIIWWSPLEEDLPEAGSRIDIAFSLRASTFRGQRQVATRFIDYRVIQQSLEVKETAPARELIDLRAEPRPLTKLKQLTETHPGIMIWSEGLERALGRRRHELEPAEKLVIYTIPPSARDLREALGKVSPQMVYLFAVDASDATRGEFLSRLAGLCKYAINQRGGIASIIELAAATSQRVVTVRHGLGWLQASGMISFEGEEEISLARGSGRVQQELKQSFESTLDSLLKETAAYRKFFSSAENPITV